MFKLVGDNIDKNIQLCTMTIDNRTKSLHYFHSFGVRDLVDLSTFSNEVKYLISAQSILRTFYYLLVMKKLSGKAFL